MLTRFGLEKGAITESGSDAAHLWVFVAPDESERVLLQDRFRLDEYNLASTLDPDEVPRFEVTEDGAFIIWKTPETTRVEESVELGVRTVGLVLAGERLAFVIDKGEVSFAAREFRAVRDVRDILLRFFLHTVHHYVGHLRVIRQMGSELEKKITVSMENRHLLQMFALSESLVYYMDALEGNGSVLGKLRGLSGTLRLEDRHVQMLDDILLENSQAARQAQIYSSVLSGLMDARGSIINNNMNVLLKNLTLINIVFLPLNLIAGIGGMSEWSMMTSGLDWRISYGLFVIGMGAFGWLTWILVTRLIDRGGSRARANPSVPPAARRLSGR